MLWLVKALFARLGCCTCKDSSLIRPRALKLIRPARGCGGLKDSTLIGPLIKYPLRSQSELLNSCPRKSHYQHGTTTAVLSWGFDEIFGLTHDVVFFTGSLIRFVVC